MLKKDDSNKKGFINTPIDPSINIIDEIDKMKKDKNAVILAHYYQTGDIQDIADFVGDSLALARISEKVKADVILFAGVNFMAETAKLLSPNKKVLIPDTNAGCSLAASCDPVEFRKFIDANPDRTVITYINSSTEIKAMSDIICTSTNALKIVDSLLPDEKIIFAPDRNLGDYIAGKIDRDMLIWDGACHVHEEFSLEAIVRLKDENRDALVIVHPECEPPVRMIADFIGSTGALLSFVQKNEEKKFIVVTEPGIIHQMNKVSPNKIFIPIPSKKSCCVLNECNFMKLITVEKIYNTLKFEEPEVFIKESIMERAAIPIRRMLEISDKLGI